MKVGFSGTRRGMSTRQFKTVELVIVLLQPKEVHHGDCDGADSEFDWLCHLRGIRRIAHPPINGRHRAYCKADVILKEKDFLKRNADIVDDSDILIAAPLTKREELRSGTWATIRYAEKKGRPVILVRP